MTNYNTSEDSCKMSNFRRYESKEKICPSNTKQEIEITVPVAVSASDNVGKIAIDCVGRPVIAEGSFRPSCDHRSSNRFTVSQKILVEIPIAFDANVEIGDEHVRFGAPREVGDADCDCDEDSEASYCDCA